jgi:hypothetical protein
MIEVWWNSGKMHKSSKIALVDARKPGKDCVKKLTEFLAIKVIVT